MPETAVVSSATPRFAKNVASNSAARRTSIVISHSSSGSLSPVCNGIEAEQNDSQFSLDKLENILASELAIRQQLNRMLKSRIFVPSERLSRFLKFIVDHVLDGNQNCLKEYVIGSEVYDRRPPYSPSMDSIVRTEARRLRNKLKEYYEGEGKDDPIYVYLRPGSYVPVFRRQTALVDALNRDTDTSFSLGQTPIAVAILPFIDISGCPLSSALARGIPDELAYILMRTQGCKVISLASMAHSSAQEHYVPTAMEKVGAQIAFEGSVREEGNHIRITARIVDAAGVQLWVERFNTEVDSETLFTIEERIASALSVGFDVVCDR